MRPTYTGVAGVIAGCDVCHGEGIAGWTAKNALAVAARHYDATGHPTWADQTISVSYGERSEPRLGVLTGDTE